MKTHRWLVVGVQHVALLHWTLWKYVNIAYCVSLGRYCLDCFWSYLCSCRNVCVCLSLCLSLSLSECVCAAYISCAPRKTSKQRQQQTHKNKTTHYRNQFQSSWPVIRTRNTAYPCNRYSILGGWSRGSQDRNQVVCSRCMLRWPRCGWTPHIHPPPGRPLRRRRLCRIFQSMTSFPAMNMAIDTKLLSSLKTVFLWKLHFDTWRREWFR